MLTISRIDELFMYLPETGEFLRRLWCGGTARVGTLAGSTNSLGYKRLCIDGSKYYAHRLVWFYEYGEWPVEQIDHINHNPSDNRIENLRCVGNAQNSRNCRLAKNNTSGITGVAWVSDRNKWRAQIMVDRKGLFLGNFNTKEEAIAARKAAEILYGFHKNHGKS